MDRKNLLRKDLRHSWHPYTQMSTLATEPPMLIDRAEGLFLFDAEGNRYYDAISSWWCVVHGHGHPGIREAVTRQMERLDHVLFAGVTHETMYGVSRFPQVQRGLERLLALRESVADPAHITLAFRTNDWMFEWRFRRQLDRFRRRGVFVSHIWTYSNYSGLVKSDDKLNLVVVDSPTKMHCTCIYARVHMAICRDGRITACGCADFEGDALSIGQAGQNSLAEVWVGEKRIGILDSFQEWNPAEICRKCSAYQPDSIFLLVNSAGGSSRTIPSPWNISSSSGKAEEQPRFMESPG